MLNSKDQMGNSLLSGYRVLDLTAQMGWLCGKILGDLGADVIKVEPPGGDPGRNIGPFYKDIVHPERSLYWFSLNTSKRGITLNIETKDGQELFRRLAKTAHFVIESFEPGFMDKLGLGYAELEKINPAIIMTSITPFGSTGPYAHYKASDITLQAMGGFAYICGDADRPPCRISLEQSYMLGGLHGTVGSVIAHYHRQFTGEGQHVDVSIQQAVTYFLAHFPEEWIPGKPLLHRDGAFRTVPGGQKEVRIRGYWLCKDGFIVWRPPARVPSGVGPANPVMPFIQAMEQEGMAEELKAYDWENFDIFQLSEEQIERMQAAFAKFFLTKTRQELHEIAIKGGLRFAPLDTVKDVVENPQLQARDYFVEIEHTELGDKILYPGAPVKLGDTAWRARSRAPLIGEHNAEVYEKELGLSKTQMGLLKAATVI